MPAEPRPSALAAELTRLIRARGPLGVGRYTELVHDHPDHGYYRRRQPFGRSGDFVTAPEVSQMFGELIGLALAQAWLDQGRPAPVRVVELGPGNGTLMADLLRATAAVPGFADGLRLHLVERSPELRAVQRDRLGERARWHERLEEVPEGPLLLVANEFLDALPVDQIVRTTSGAARRCIGLDAAAALVFVEGPAVAVPDALVRAAPGTIHEVSPARDALVREVSRRIAAAGGLALLIDYGAVAAGATGDTLQAVRDHRPVDPLDGPGTADLSTQVDFAPLVAAATGAGARVGGPVFQGTFLRTLGIEVRALRLLERAEPAAADAIRRALFRLTDASAMGAVFKVLAIAPADAPPPPGFVADD